jgi:hypothetical protein
MTPAELAEELERVWKNYLDMAVLSRYNKGEWRDADDGLNLWAFAFEHFLEEHSPNDAAQFRQTRSHANSEKITLKNRIDSCFEFVDKLVNTARQSPNQDLEIRPSKALKQVNATTVFLSYAREDIKQARRLFNDLRKLGVAAWFDEEYLLPGQKWKVTIRQAIRDSRFFLALLSTNSLNKRGYVQKEVREAFDIMDEYPDSAIYLIPVRLENCSPSDDRLSNLHWVDMFPVWEEGLARILKVVET